MSLFIFLTVVQAIVAALLVVVILMQKSEGGGLGVGGSPAGFMSARGAADFMTRLTTILATAFVVLSIALAALAVGTNSSREIDTSLERNTPMQNAPANDPLAPAQGAQPGAAPAQQVPAPANDPLNGAAGQ
ncbi:preprotein translocase subunit SecG [Novosphingobium sp. THN1]|uniref:preprotein translocase subunit SecG n=1 Tax=Novosphingobium sp. THN1 TaxID=1016987 RepID=UPI002680F6F6